MAKFNRLIVFCLILIFAQNIHAGQYFCDEMNHFSFEKECIMKQEEKEQKNVKENETIELWCEPQLDPSTGQILCRMPPKPVLDLLNNPNEENAKSYLEWNQKKIEKITKAQQVVSQITESKKQISINDISSVEFYFSPNCPYCIKQASVIKKLSKYIPDKITGYLVIGDNVSLAKFLQLTGLKIKIYYFNSFVNHKNITQIPVTIIYLKNNEQKEFVGYNDTLDILELSQKN